MKKVKGYKIALNHKQLNYVRKDPEWVQMSKKIVKLVHLIATIYNTLLHLL